MANLMQTQGAPGSVQYRRAKLWQIILVAANGLNGMAIYTLINMAQYSASIGYGIATLAVGGILMFTRIFDAVTDPLLAFLYDRVNTRFGKVRPLMLLGWLIQSIGLVSMFIFFSSKGFGAPMFIVCYLVYVVGYTIVNMTAQTLPALMTNDPKQRPTIGVWTTVFNYLVPMALMIVMNTVLLPKYGEAVLNEAGETAYNYTQLYLTVACIVCVVLSFVGVLLVCIGIKDFDRPENFRGTEAKEKRLSIKDMWNTLVHNKPLQAFIISAASDKIAQQAQSAQLVTTMLLGILVGNLGLGTILSVIGMFPSIVFAIIGAKYAGKHGNKESIVTWTRNCVFANVAIIAFFVLLRYAFGGTATIGNMFSIPMILFVLLTLVCNGFAMCVTTANNAYMADIIDYELDRSGKYVPAVVSGTYSLVDKIVSSFSSVIATGAVALIGYTATLPQPGDAATDGVFWMTMFLRYGLAIIGWIITLVAMHFCKLGKKEMVDVQIRIADKKAAAKAAMEAEQQ